MRISLIIKKHTKTKYITDERLVHTVMENSSLYSSHVGQLTSAQILHTVSPFNHLTILFTRINAQIKFQNLPKNQLFFVTDHSTFIKPHQ